MAYFKLNKERVVYLDIDDSSITWLPTTYKYNESEILRFTEGNNILEAIPHKRNIDFVKNLKVQGYGVVCWSSAGATWTETVIKKLGLEDLPDVILSKPELCVDDMLEPKRIIKSIVWIDPDTGDFKRNV